MANFFTKALDKITPWRRGGELQREEEERQRSQPQQNQNNYTPSRNYSPNISVSVARPTQNVSVEGTDQPYPVPKPKKQENILENLNKNLVFNKPQNIIDTFRENSQAVEQPSPGMIVQPNGRRIESNEILERPNQSLWNKARDVFDTNTEADKYRRAKVQSSRMEEDLLRSGVDPVKARVTAIQVAKADSQAIPGWADIARETGKEVGYDFIGKPLKTVFGTPVEAGRNVVAEVTGNRGAAIAAERRLNENLFRRGGADKVDSGESLGWMDLLASAGDALSVLPMLKGASILKGGAKEAINTRTLNPFLKGSAAAADEVTLGLRNLFRRPGATGDLADIKRVDVPVAKDIQVAGIDGLPEPVNVRNLNEPKPLIKEFPGDAPTTTPDALIKKTTEDATEATAREASFDQAKTTGKSDPRIEGVTPAEPTTPFKLDDNVVKSSQYQIIDGYAAQLKQLGEGNGVSVTPDGRRVSNNARPSTFGPKRATKAMWREEAERQLKNGDADSAFQKPFSDAGDPDVQSLINKGDQGADKPQGRPITVKQSKGIDVTDNTDVPTNLPETPGKVRVTTSTEPNKVKSEAVANEPVTRTPAKLPTETQAILDNPKQFTKRQVAAARKQRKNARALAKTQEETADAMGKIKRVSATPTDSKGFAPTGEFKKGKNGNISETATRKAEAELGKREMATKSVNEVIERTNNKKRLDADDFRQLQDALKTVKDANPKYADLPEYKLLRDSLNKGKSDIARQMGLMEKINRRISTGEAISGRWENKMSKTLDDTSKLGSEELKAVQDANIKFTDLRDEAARLQEAYKTDPTKANLDSFKKASKLADEANVAAKNVEVRAAKKVLKGSKSENTAKVLNDLEKEAELNMMDHLTASQLSGPATGGRNLYGTELAGVENRVGANSRSKITDKLFNNRLMNKVRPGKVNVGGFSRKGAKIGRKEGFNQMVSDAKNRANYSGYNPIKHARNFATTINSLGESGLHAQKQSRVLKYYENQAKAKGLTGDSLKNDAEFLRITDPDGFGQEVMDSVMKSSGLSGIYKSTQKFETNMAAQVSSKLGKVLPPKSSDFIGKAITRIAFGYPTATGNFVFQSGKRAMLGVPSFTESGFKLARGDKQAAALAFDRGLKEAGSGAAAMGTGYMLAQADLISGFYPEDKDERKKWKDEGKSELSIKIGGTWHPIPQGFGMFGLPLLVGALGQSGGVDEVVSAFTTRDNLMKLSPADQAMSFLEVMAGGSTENQDKSFAASTIRSLIPAGSFLNQTAKGLDETVNDTTTKDFWANVRDQVISGIPGLNNASDIPDKLSSTGVPLKNPNLAQVYSGARTAEQKSGVENSKKVDKQINDSLKSIKQYGLLDDENLKGVIEDTGLEALNKYNNGQQLDESDIKSLKADLVKGVSISGTDTAYLEREQYDTNLAVLKLKRDIAKEDPTVAPSNLEKLDTAIKRGEIYKKDKIPYEDISDYKDIGVEEWRKMGIPPGKKYHDEDLYDPDMYEKLWQMDQKMTKAGVSYNTKGLDKNKYYVKKSKSGSGGGSKVKSIKTGFKGLKSGSFAPKVKAFESIDTRSGNIPTIRTVRPNIRNKISSSR